MNYYLLLALLVFVYMNVWYMVSLIQKRNDVVDVAWGLGFVLLAWSSFIIIGIVKPLALLVNLLVTVWGVRLALHIYLRNRKKSEDFRYNEWRKNWGKLFLIRSYFQVYMLQGLLMFIVSLPVLYINKNASYNLSLLSILGLMVWLFGFFFEAVRDYQLKKFVSDVKNKGKIMQSGLWKYTRHPNYFGEVTLWWGVFIMAMSLSFGLITIIGPLTITILILFISGIPLLEKKYADRENFKEYKKKTSIFFPLPPLR